MICPNCKKENMNQYATVCAYCGHELYDGGITEEKAKAICKLLKSALNQEAVVLEITELKSDLI